MDPRRVRGFGGSGLARSGMRGRKTAVAAENPLVPDRVLRRLHTLLLEQRAMEEAMARAGDAVARAGAGRSGACLASLAVSLRRGDLLSEAAIGVGMGLLLDGDASKAGVTLLPAMAVPTERLLMAVGAAVALKSGVKGRVLAVLVEQGEMPTAMWRQMLGFVARLELPMLIVVLPGAKARPQGELSARSQGWGVPGFPVDADDALAMYRVVRESMGRLRAGEGPVLLEGIRWRAGRRAGDGLTRLEETMRSRGFLG